MGRMGWLNFGGFSIQPAEYLKIILVWYLALVFSKKQEEIQQYDYQALTHNQWIPRDLADWSLDGALLDRYCSHHARLRKWRPFSH